MREARRSQLLGDGERASVGTRAKRCDSEGLGREREGAAVEVWLMYSKVQRQMR